MTAGRSFSPTGPGKATAATPATPATPGKATLTQQLVLRGLTKEEVLAMIEAATRDGVSAPAAIAARSPYGAAAQVHTGEAAAALAEAAGTPVVVVDEHVVVAAGLDAQSPSGQAAIATAVSAGPVAPVSKNDADGALMCSLSVMMHYGRPFKPIDVPAAFAAPIASIASACGSTDVAPEIRRRQLDQGVAGLSQARAAARPDLVEQFSSELAVVHHHLEDELVAGGAAGADPLATMMETRAALGRAGGIAIEMRKLVSFANNKRLAGAGKSVDWVAFGGLIAKFAQELPIDSPALEEAIGAIGGASFELGFALLDQVLTGIAAGKTIGDNPVQHDPAKDAQTLKALIDLSCAVLNGCMLTGHTVALACMTVTTGAAQKTWTQLAGDLGKGVKLVGGTFGVLTSACDIAANVVILWNGAEGIEAADACAAIAGSSAGLLAAGTKLLLDTGVIAPAAGMFAGSTAGAAAASILAIAAPLAVVIPVTWFVTKALLVELGKLRIGITGAMMSQAFDQLITDAEALARETEVLGAALNSALDPTADPEVVKTAVEGRVQLVSARVETLRHNAVNQRAVVIKREVSKLCASTAPVGPDPLEVAAGARATVIGVMTILERTPELVAEEAGDPTFVDRARNGAPAPEPGPM